MRIVFLDLDGVAIHHDSLRAARDEIREGGEPNESALRTLRPMNYLGLDPAVLSAISDVCEEVGAVVVITSTLRMMHGIDDLSAVLADRGLRVPVVGMTPRLYAADRWSSTTFTSPRTGHQDIAARGTEILFWLSRHGRDVTDLCIIDDDGDMGSLKPWLVSTAMECGFLPWQTDLMRVMLTAGVELPKPDFTVNGESVT